MNEKNVLAERRQLEKYIKKQQRSLAYQNKLLQKQQAELETTNKLMAEADKAIATADEEIARLEKELEAETKITKQEMLLSQLRLPKQSFDDYFPTPFHVAV